MTTSTPIAVYVNLIIWEPTVRQRLMIVMGSSVGTMEPVWMELIHSPPTVLVGSPDITARQDLLMVNQNNFITILLIDLSDILLSFIPVF